MPRGDKSSYTDKQKRQAEHIEEGYEKRGILGPRGRTPRLGHGEQGNPWRQEERLRPRQARRPRAVAQGRPPGRTRVGEPVGGGPFALGQKGSRDPQAARLPVGQLRVMFV